MVNLGFGCGSETKYQEIWLLLGFEIPGPECYPGPSTSTANLEFGRGSETKDKGDLVVVRH